MRSSQDAFDLIVREEVSSKALYIKRYQRPVWPGERSGPTVGIGYDLGQTERTTIRSDWSGRVSSAMVEAMVSCSGHTGSTGQAKTAQVKNKILIPWDLAIAVHEERVVPRWEARLAKSLPNTGKLHPDSFGALLSLIFNRGTSFNLSGDRYREMRAIKAHMKAERFDAIPNELRSMKRLWTLTGLRKRRDAEARLFERGLQSGPVELPEEPDAHPEPLPQRAPWWKRLWLRWTGGALGTYLGLSEWTDWQIAAVMMAGGIVVAALIVLFITAFVGSSGRATIREWIVRQFRG